MTDYIAGRALDDGKKLWVMPLLGGRARLAIGPADSPFFDNEW